MKRIGILVVHGIGEQRQFEFLQTIAGNLFRALSQDCARKPHIQIRRGDQVSQLSPTESWRLTPAIVRWWSSERKDWIEAHFREVTWADLDLPKSLWTWWRLVGWGLAMPGVRLLRSTRTLRSRAEQVCLPVGLDRVNSDRIRLFLVRILGERIVAGGLEPILGRIRRSFVRLGLGVVSLLFFLMLISVNLFYWVLQRFSIRLSWVEGARDTIYDYLGDVKLYQDWADRDDESLEALGEKSRAAIQRRMVRALVAMAEEIRSGEPKEQPEEKSEKKPEEKPEVKLDAYYIFAHSLGTVIAFNALMELDVTLPNYFTEEEWTKLPKGFKTEATDDPPVLQKPRRPPWLLGKRAAMDRARLFAGLKGFLTMGSPLDKIATLWPAIVPINKKALPNPVPWVNVADRQDFVAGNEINLFRSCNGKKTDPQDVAGLRLVNFPWADRWTPFTAHTSYWTAKFPSNNPLEFLMNWLTGHHQERLMNRLIPWLESGDVGKFVPPRDRTWAWVFTLVYVGWLLAVVGVLSFIPAYFLHLLAKHAPTREALSSLPYVGPLFDQSVETLKSLCALAYVPGQKIVCLMVFLIIVGVVVVTACSFIRLAWELSRHYWARN